MRLFCVLSGWARLAPGVQRACLRRERDRAHLLSRMSRTPYLSIWVSERGSKASLADCVTLTCAQPAEHRSARVHDDLKPDPDAVNLGEDVSIDLRYSGCPDVCWSKLWNLIGSLTVSGWRDECFLQRNSCEFSTLQVGELGVTASTMFSGESHLDDQMMIQIYGMGRL